MTATPAPDVPTSLREAVAQQMFEIDALERDLIKRYEREEELLKMLTRRDAEIKKLKATNEEIRSQRKQANGRAERAERDREQTRREARKQTDRAAAVDKRYQALASSKLGAMQRRWWKLRSGKQA